MQINNSNNENVTTVPILIIAGIAGGARYAHDRRRRLEDAERASGLRAFPVGTVLYELDGTLVQVGEIAPAGGRLVRLRDFSGPQTVMSWTTCAVSPRPARSERRAEGHSRVIGEGSASPICKKCSA